ncbi:low molecular weight protein arginine phosphatase [Xylanibacillus composti]|uniref:Low molecular weight phosphatase family protein n=1 Tax=Xylanibacillus composti TaxID=1572762 RepID=A0A8J4H6N9_9BACL|nr:low molecular weight protein arginine phosphatase [Xylanibacillus composti]GIQ70841.1 low molecular weight phosphatase family protein [Xylanibacillus composti]
MVRVLFVCTGNTCRSPMAEKLFRQMAQEHMLAAEARSAGVAAADGTPMSKHAATVIREAGCPTEHRSRSLEQEDVDWADLILTMTQGHKRTILQMFPYTVEKVYTLQEYAWNDSEQKQMRMEWEAFMAELQTKQALGETIAPAEHERMQQLADHLRDDDIADPFGGTEEHYRIVAEEIRYAVDKLVRKLAQDAGGGAST